jgi:GTP cyclohydrolase I
MSGLPDDEDDDSGLRLCGVDRPRIARAVREILEAIGEDPDRDGLQDTPGRVARMYDEIFSGLRESPDHHLKVLFEAEQRSTTR